MPAIKSAARTARQIITTTRVIASARLLGPRAGLRSRRDGALQCALEIDRLQTTRPIHECIAIGLRRLDRALADHSATAPRGELEPPFPHGCALALATHSPRRINVAVFVPDLAREFVKEFAHVRTTPRMACQLRSRYRRVPRDKGLGLDHQHRGGTAWPEILCISRSTRKTQIARSVSTARSSDGSTRTPRCQGWSTT